jgi:lysophospholipase L1-like esterase
MLRVLRIVLVNFAVVVTSLALLAIAVDIYLRIAALGMDDYDRRRAESPNYAGADWAMTHFREVDELRALYFSYVEWRRELYDGETINIVGPFHERVTAVAEGASGGAVWFFGGSSIWGEGARDQETVPSYYSQLTRRPTRNFGEPAYTVHHSIEMLLWVLQEESARPEAVVFYDGVNDVTQKCRSGVTPFAHAKEERMRALLVTRPGLIDRVWVPLQVQVEELLDRRSVAEAFDCDDKPEKARAVADSVIRDWRIARTLAEAEGLRFFAVLQPVVYFSESPADHRADLGPRDDELGLQYEAVYPLIQQRLAEVGAIDLTQVLDGQELYYVDFCHLSPNGNERVAQALAEAIEPQLTARQ